MDHATLEVRLRRIAGLCDELEAAADLTFDRFAASPDLQAATERRVHAALHSVVNVAAVIVNGRDWGLPGSARDAIATLAERLVLDDALVHRLKSAMVLRDQLAHDDPALTPARLHVQLGGLRRDLTLFHDRIGGWLDDQTLHEPGS